MLRRSITYHAAASPSTANLASNGHFVPILGVRIVDGSQLLRVVWILRLESSRTVQPRLVVSNMMFVTISLLVHLSCTLQTDKDRLRWRPEENE